MGIKTGITDAAGCYEQTQTTIVIRDKPRAGFSSNIVCEGVANDFTDESNVNASVIDTWQWDLGDGIGTATTANPSYSYTQAGVYQAELVVETDHGCKDTIIKDVIVNATPVISISGIDTCLNNVTVFSNNSSPQDNTITSWDWDFGDATTATGVTASTTYLDYGIYTVMLTATSDSGCVASGTKQIEVFPNPVRDILHVKLIEPKSDVVIQYRILDASGAVVNKGRLDSEAQQIDISEVTAGLYYIEFRDRAGTLVGSEKFVRE